MAKTSFRVGEHGVDVEIETGTDLSGYALGDLSLEVKKPDGATASWAAGSLITGEVASSVIVYTLVAADLPLRGNYIIHPHLDSASPDVFKYGDPPAILRVFDTFQDVR